jgi:hypothetical protein
VSLVVGGSITIPHLRRAVERVEECRKLNEHRAVRTKRGSR